SRCIRIECDDRLEARENLRPLIAPGALSACTRNRRIAQGAAAERVELATHNENEGAVGKIGELLRTVELRCDARGLQEFRSSLGEVAFREEDLPRRVENRNRESLPVVTELRSANDVWD